MAKFPDFVIIGSMKCGTTALWRNCAQHPDITMGKNPDDPKRTSTEIRFWNNGGPHHPWRRGMEWYRSLFDGKCCGEKCANYIESPEAMTRMNRAMPNTRLVLCVRNPVDRILSEFWMHHFKPEKISKFPRFSRKAGPLTRGRYADQIYRGVWRTGWRPYQLYILIQERMANDTVGEMNKLFEWLGVPCFKLPVVEVSFEERDCPVDGFRTWHTAHGCGMLNSTRAELEKYYASHNRRLAEYLGSGIPEWGLD